MSAFRGKNAAVGNFRVFLDAIKTGKVLPGSVLLVESFDRISRQGIDEGYDLIKSILKAGIRIVTLSPEREFDASATKSLSRGALEIQLILERAAEESERKSDRIGKAWANKLRNAGAKVVTRRVPGWIAHTPDGLKLNDHAATVRRVFAMTIAGHSALAVAKALIADHTPVIGRATMKGRAVEWSSSVVRHILTTRAAIGEYTPYATDRKRPAGDPVPNYYPAVVDEVTFYRAQGGIKTRAAVGRGRKGKHVNLFAGLLTDARTGGPMMYGHYTGGPDRTDRGGSREGEVGQFSRRTPRNRAAHQDARTKCGRRDRRRHCRRSEAE